MIGGETADREKAAGRLRGNEGNDAPPGPEGREEYLARGAGAGTPPHPS